jgi:hypothetical protein
MAVKRMKQFFIDEERMKKRAAKRRARSLKEHEEARTSILYSE